MITTFISDCNNITMQIHFSLKFNTNHYILIQNVNTKGEEEKAT